jgi:hypothetical protein
MIGEGETLTRENPSCFVRAANANDLREKQGTKFSNVAIYRNLTARF